MTEPVPPLPAPTVEDHPGRWVGGLVGALASLGVAAVGVALGETREPDADWLDLDLIGLGIGGLPVGFMLGRALLPWTRSAGWKTALGAGVAAGFVAPPLGAVVLLALALVQSAWSLEAALVFPYLLAFALPYSYVAIVATLPAGVAASLVGRALPGELLRRARMPWPVSKLGVRHALAVLAVAAVAAAAVPYVADATDEFVCFDLDGEEVQQAAWLPDERGFAVVLGEPRGPARRVARIASTGEVEILRERGLLLQPRMAVAPNGSIAWLEATPGVVYPDEPTTDLWIAEPTGGAALAGTISASQVDALAWWRDGWVVRQFGELRSVDRLAVDGALGTRHLELGNVPPMSGSGPLSTSRDGRLIAWLVPPGETGPATAVIVGGPVRHVVELPRTTRLAALAASGDAALYRLDPDGTTRIRPIGEPSLRDPAVDPVLVDDRWLSAIVAADGRIAARSAPVASGLGQNRLCVSPPGRAPEMAR